MQQYCFGQMLQLSNSAVHLSGSCRHRTGIHETRGWREGGDSPGQPAGRSGAAAGLPEPHCHPQSQISLQQGTEAPQQWVPHLSGPSLHARPEACDATPLRSDYLPLNSVVPSHICPSNDTTLWHDRSQYFSASRGTVARLLVT